MQCIIGEISDFYQHGSLILYIPNTINDPHWYKTKLLTLSVSQEVNCWIIRVTDLNGAKQTDQCLMLHLSPALLIAVTLSKAAPGAWLVLEVMCCLPGNIMKMLKDQNKFMMRCVQVC